MVVVAVIAALNPRGDALRRVYLSAELAALFAGVASIVAWYRRRGERATTTTLTAAILVAGHFATVVTGAYRFGLFGRAWLLSQWAYLAIITIIILLHIQTLWTSDR